MHCYEQLRYDCQGGAQVLQPLLHQHLPALTCPPLHPHQAHHGQRTFSLSRQPRMLYFSSASHRMSAWQPGARTSCPGWMSRYSLTHPHLAPCCAEVSAQIVAGVHRLLTFHDSGPIEVVLRNVCYVQKRMLHGQGLVEAELSAVLFSSLPLTRRRYQSRIYPAVMLCLNVQVLAGAQMDPEKLSGQKLGDTISQLLGSYQELKPSAAQVSRAWSSMGCRNRALRELQPKANQ